MQQLLLSLLLSLLLTGAAAQEEVAIDPTNATDHLDFEKHVQTGQNHHMHEHMKDTSSNDGAEYCMKNGVWTDCKPPKPPPTPAPQPAAAAARRAAAAGGGPAAVTEAGPTPTPACVPTETECCRGQTWVPTSRGENYDVTVLFAHDWMSSPCHEKYTKLVGAVKGLPKVKFMMLTAPHSVWHQETGKMNALIDPPPGPEYKWFDMSCVGTQCQDPAYGNQQQMQESFDVIDSQLTQVHQIAPDKKIVLMGHGQGCAMMYYAMLNSVIAFEKVFHLVCISGWVPIRDPHLMSTSLSSMLMSLRKNITHYHALNDDVIPYWWAQVAQAELKHSHQPVHLLPLESDAHLYTLLNGTTLDALAELLGKTIPGAQRQ